MKLLSKTSLYFLTIALLLLFLGGIGFYFLFKHMMIHELEKELMINMHHLIVNTSKNNNLVENHQQMPLQIAYDVETIASISNKNFEMNDSLIYDPILQKYQEYKIIQFELELNQKAYRFSISKSLTISDSLIEKLALSIFFLSLLFLLCFSLFNRYILSKVWSNFFETIKTIQSYEISSSDTLVFGETEIYEFRMLNEVLTKMMNKIKLDFINLKEFNENISHEIQTPLAIIKTKIDLLIQNENLEVNQISLIQAIQNSTNRLSNLSKSLHLLAKIDNNQYSANEKVDIKSLIDFHIVNFEDIINENNIKVVKNYSNDIFTISDFHLINILVLNILKNAVRHNIQNGVINIYMEKNQLTIGNTSHEREICIEDLFKRFSKRSSKADSLGLGLAIIKKICDYYHFSIEIKMDQTYTSISIGFV